MSFKHSLIGKSYRNILRPYLFKLDPENAHDAFTNFGAFLGKSQLAKTLTKNLFDYQNEALSQKVAGINFHNPVGLSAGFDKDANLQNILPSVGFGFMHIGSVTLNPYEGNPKPRLVRLPKSKGLIVYYGLKGIGVKKIIRKLKDFNNSTFPLGISVAKTNCSDTATAKEGIEDYYQCIKELVKSDIGDFYTINISCPNAFGGEPFTTTARLDPLLKIIATLNIKKPIFVKMPINLSWVDFKKLLDVIVKYELDGVIIGNLTKKRDTELIKDELPKNIKGGISGKPTEKLNNNLISKTYKQYQDKLIIIGVGGIFNAADAYDKIKRGATLVQLITGMVFEGPQLIGEINQKLVILLKKDGYRNIREAVGAYY